VKFSKFHGGYISDGRVLWILTYILSYSEDSYQKDIILRTTIIFLTPYLGLVAKDRKACHICLLLRHVTNCFLLHVGVNAAQ